jgi:hypothetical protein
MTHAVFCLIGTSAQADRIIRALGVLGLVEVSLMVPGGEAPPDRWDPDLMAAPHVACLLDLPGTEGFTVVGPLLRVWLERKPTGWAGIADALEEIGLSPGDAVFIVRHLADGYGLIVVHTDHPDDLARAEGTFLAADAAGTLRGEAAA